MRGLLSDILIEKIRGDANFLIFQLLLGEIDGYGATQYPSLLTLLHITLEFNCRSAEIIP
jgi:hypothetical protein